jgi:peptide/nickel transport system permease protein
MGLAPAAYIARVTRASVLAMARQPYVNTAHAKGLSDSTVGRRHVLRNALLPVITIIGLTAGVLLEGAALVEIVFSWGGVGSLLYQAVTARDYPVLQAGILLVTVLLVLLNLLLDLIYAWVDPRVRVA